MIRKLGLLFLLNFVLCLTAMSAPDDKLVGGIGYPFTIHGKVFVDKNGDGAMGKEETGLGGIGVSDGRDVVLTKPDGTFEFPNADHSAKIVFVSTPRDYRKMAKFYFGLDELTTEQDFQFPLVPSEKKDEKEFRFVQTTDIHITSLADEAQFVQCIQEINSLSRDIAFVIATGDLTNVGDKPEQFENYSKGIATSKYTWLNVFGNHDVNKGDDFTRNYRRFLGPDYYSFDYSEYHFIILNSIKPQEKQNLWLQQDLEKLAKGKKLIVFQHYPPKPTQVKELQGYGVRAILSGHWHSNKIVDHDGLMDINTPTFRFGGIDVSPAGFRILDVNGDKLETVYKIGGQYHRLSIPYPSPDLEIHPDDFHISGDAYETSAEVTGIDYHLQDEKGKVQSGRLSKKTEWSWVGDTSPILVQEGKYQLQEIAHNDKSESWEKSIAFQVVNSPLVPSSPTTEWATFKGSASRTGLVNYSIKPPFRLAWRYPSDGNLDFASPIISQGILFMSVKDRHGLAHNGLLALDAVSGKKLWYLKTESEINHSATAFNNKVFVVTVGGIVYAADAKTGNTLWTYSLAENGYERWVYAAPVVYDGNLYIGSAAKFACLNPENGEVRWVKSYGSDWISSLSSPAIVDDKLFFGAIWNDKSCFAVDPKTGTILWVYKTSGLHTSPVADDGKVFVADIDGKMMALSEDSGVELWKFNLGKGWSVTVPSVAEDMVIAGSSSGSLHALNKAIGQPIWSFSSQSSLVRMSPYNDDYSSVFSSPIISGDLVYIGCSDGHLYALDRKTGQKFWSYDVGVPLVSTPAISGNMFFFAAYDGNIYALASQNH